MNKNRFKFRVWDKTSKRYFYLELKFGDNGYHPDFITDPVFEQCTGLKDKNGNLIYEGDLLFDGEFCGVVIWKDSSWQVRFELYDGESGYERLDQYFAEFGQIYGNIHEQKDNK